MNKQEYTLRKNIRDELRPICRRYETGADAYTAICEAVYTLMVETLRELAELRDPDLPPLPMNSG